MSPREPAPPHVRHLGPTELRVLEAAVAADDPVCVRELYGVRVANLAAVAALVALGYLARTAAGWVAATGSGRLMLPHEQERTEARRSTRLIGGAGGRRADCAKLAACEVEWITQHPDRITTTQARCPKACQAWVARAPRPVAVGIASTLAGSV